MFQFIIFVFLSLMGNFLLQVSAYSSFGRTLGLGFEQHKRRLESSTNEPLFTNVTRDFIGTRDYIFYTGELFCFNLLNVNTHRTVL